MFPFIPKTQALKGNCSSKVVLGIITIIYTMVKKCGMFGLLTIHKRMYLVLTEALISEHIIPYFHEVTITDDAITLTKKQIKFTRD